MRPRELMGFTKMTGDLIRAMREVPVPIISGIQGIAAGAGSVVALASDFRVCARSARFAFLFTKVGLSGGDMGAAYLLPRVVGAGRATQLLMLGDTIDADTADRYGLVSELVDDDRAGRRRGAAGRPAGHRPGPGLRADEGADHPRAGHVPGRRDGARRHDPGAADDHRRPRRVPRRVQRAPPAALVGHVTAAADLPGHRRRAGDRGRRRGAAVGGRPPGGPARRGTPARSTGSGRDLPGPALSLAADVTDPAAVEAALARLEAEWGPVEVLVSNAGAGTAAALVDTTDDDWARMLELNLTAPFRLVRRTLPGDDRARAGAGSSWSPPSSPSAARRRWPPTPRPSTASWAWSGPRRRRSRAPASRSTRSAPATSTPR